MFGRATITLGIGPHSSSYMWHSVSPECTSIDTTNYDYAGDTQRAQKRRLWTRVGRRMHKFNRIRQVAPMCSYRRTRCRHLSNSIEPSVFGNDAPYGKLLWPLVIFGHAHLDSQTDSQALRAEYCAVGIPHNTAIWLYLEGYNRRNNHACHSRSSKMGLFKSHIWHHIILTVCSNYSRLCSRCRHYIFVLWFLLSFFLSTFLFSL